MKKTVLLIMFLCVVLTCSATHALGTDEDKIILSELSEEECLIFIAEQNVRVPDELQEYERLGEFVKSIIVTVESEPNYIFTYNYQVVLDFVNEIKQCVNSYYGKSVTCEFSSRQSNGFYTLVDNETVGVWDDIFTEYNCYAYALFYNASPTDSYFAPYPGYFSAPNDFSILESVDTWADQTEADLVEIGYSCVYKTNSLSAIMEFSDTHTIICLRKGNHPDFHYMRWDINSWYHKPGQTHILRYLYTNPNYKNWIAEYSVQGVDYPPIDDTRYYTGTIYYFAFAENHSFTGQTYTGVHNHLGTRHLYKFSSVCEHCGEIKYSWVSVSCDGPPCALEYMGIAPEESVQS